LTLYKRYDTGADSTGNSFFIDLGLHGVESFFNLSVLSGIAAGGIIMGIAILGDDLNFSVEVADLTNKQRLELR